MTTREEALKDFRYTDSANGGIEAYQITDRARWQDEDWPPWLNKQRTKGEINVVYTDGSKPDALFIALDGGDGQLGYNAYVIQNADGSLSVMGEYEFLDVYTKVVPVPEKVQTAPADGQTDQEFYDSLPQSQIEKLGLRNPSKTPQLVAVGTQVAAPAVNDAVEVGVLREQMKVAIDLLKGGQSKGAIKATQNLQIGLDTAKDGGLVWCNCRPGVCDKSTEWGCRKNSPLL